MRLRPSFVRLLACRFKTHSPLESGFTGKPLEEPAKQSHTSSIDTGWRLTHRLLAIDGAALTDGSGWSGTMEGPAIVIRATGWRAARIQQPNQDSTMPAPRRGFSRVRDIGTVSSNGSFAILFMATSIRCWRSTRTRTGVHWPYGRRLGNWPEEGVL